MEPLELPLIVRRTRWSIVMSLIGAVIVAGFLFWLPDIYSNPLQFGLACLFCFIAAVCLGSLLDRKPDLVVSREGIHAPHWGEAEIIWDELDDVFVKSSPDGDYLCMTLRQPDEYRAKGGYFVRIVNTASRETGFGDLTIKPTDVGLEANELLPLIRRQIARSRTEPKRPPSAVKYRAG